MSGAFVRSGFRERLRIVRVRLRALYHGSSRAAVRFRLTVMVVDFATIAFFIAAPLLKNTPAFLLIDYAVAAVLAADLAGRCLAAPSLRSWLRRPAVWIDFFVLATLLFPMWLYNLGFLRVLRLWSLVHSEFFWRTIGRRYDNSRVEDIAKSLAALATFVFVMTGFVYTSFALRYEGIRGYVDALYFTVTSLTTTGYGDIVLPGIWGRVLSIITMLAGVSLFISLVQALARPPKVRWPCPACALQRHDRDAVHCKACGALLNIPNEE